MTQKDYIKLAQALKDSKPTKWGIGSNELEFQTIAWRNVVETLTMTLQHDNPRFNRSRFLRACDYN